MELAEILQKMQRPEALVELNEIALIVQHITNFIGDFELQHDELKTAYSFRWEEIKYSNEMIGKPLTDKQTEIKMLRDPLTAQLNAVKRTLGELRRYRSDLNRKMDIIMNIKRTRN